MNTIICPHCKKELEISEAIRHQIEEKTLADVSDKHKKELEAARKTAQDELLKKLQDDEILKEKEREQEQRSYRERQEKQQKQIMELMDMNKKLQDKNEDAEIIMKKQLMEERVKIQEEISKREHEKASLEKRELEKQLDDMKKALEEANRKGSQKSQQLQGEVLELEIEEILQEAFAQDEIVPVAKGTKGADIKQIVKSPKGFRCGLILWEFKRTQDWSDKWIAKLKEDARSANADISVIISTNLPKEMHESFGMRDDIWVCSLDLIVPLAVALRKCLLDVGYQKAIAVNRGSKADDLYNLITSREFAQQVKTIIEVYGEINTQIQREKAAFEKSWKQREAQAQRLLSTTANIVGSIQGKIGASTLHIPELELLGTGDES